jgi:hypothetical protein
MPRQFASDQCTFNRTARTFLVISGTLLLSGVLSVSDGAENASANLAESEVGDQPADSKVEKLDVTRKLNLDEGEARAIELEGQPGMQTLTVEFSSSKADVSVYVFDAKNARGEDGLLAADPKRALAGAKSKAATIKAVVPAKASVRVVIRGATMMTNVEMRITNQAAADAKEAQIKKLLDENASLKKDVEELQRQLASTKKPQDKKE